MYSNAINSLAHEHNAMHPRRFQYRLKIDIRVSIYLGVCVCVPSI